MLPSLCSQTMRAVMASLTRPRHLCSLAGSLHGPRVRAPLALHVCTGRQTLAAFLQRQSAAIHEPSDRKHGSSSRLAASAQEFPAATVDYDADSDSIDEFSSGDEAPLDFLDLDAEDTDSQDTEFEAAEDKDDSVEDDLDDEEPPIASTSGDGPTIEFAGIPSWGKAALQAAENVLKLPELAGLQLYSFRAAAKRDRLYIRLDKLDDKYGSPSLDEVAKFSQEFSRALDAKIGEEAAGKLSVEVSSPGAERMVRVPSELQRFQTLPMLVTHETESEKGSRVLRLLELDTEAGTSVWGLADVRVNRDKRQKLTKKQEAQRFAIPLSAIKQARLHLDA